MHREQHSETSLYRTLTRRPEATTVTVRVLLQKVFAGAVRIPGFQRPLRWKRSDVVDLLDSIWRGYPIGSLLFWKRKAEAAEVPIGGARISAPAVSDAWWVVDGQQRTTALAAALLDLDHAGDSRWIVHFNPTTETFRGGPVVAEREGLDVPVTVLGDLRRLGRWLRGTSLDDEAATKVEEAQQRLLDYAIPAYVVETDDEQALRGVFARMNSSGARMRADEVFQALLGAPSSAEHESLDLDALQDKCATAGFGTPPRSELLKAVLAISGHDPTRRVEDLRTLESMPLASREDVAEALSRTIEFLREDCSIPHFSLLPYPVVFFILARWFHVHPSSEPAIRGLLARWLWRGAVSGAHQRAEVSRMREQVRDIVSDKEEESLDRLLARVESRPTKTWTLDRFNSRNARSRIEILALLERKPQDRLGFVRIEELIGDRVAREVFRAPDWKELEKEVKALGESAANRVILGGAHTGLSAELKTWDWASHRTALDSHLIDERALDHLKAADVRNFLTRRADRFRLVVEGFIAAKAAWDEPDIRPLRTYFDGPDANPDEGV